MFLSPSPPLSFVLQSNSVWNKKPIIIRSTMMNSRRLFRASHRVVLQQSRQGSLRCLAPPNSLVGRSQVAWQRPPPFRCLSSPAATEESKEATEGSETTTSNTEQVPPPAPPAEKLEFQAETRQLLDIVTHSLYTDKEVFLRELVSNASDSLEKLRHLQATNQVALGSSTDTAATDNEDVPLEIRIELDEVTSSITITDTGVGMTRDELISNLGTIAKSGSKNFLEEFKKSQQVGVDPGRGIIGKFGVGFCK